MKWSPFVIVALIFWVMGCSSNPVVGKKEPLEAVQECVEKFPPGPPFLPDGHLYTTLAIAQIAGYSDARQLALSYFSQYPDIDPNYEATPVAFKYLPLFWEWKWRNDITGVLHSLHGGYREEINIRRKKIREMLSYTLKNPQFDWLSGLAIHAYADSYAHTKNEYNSDKEKAYGVWIGHAIPSLFGRSPDDIKKNEPKYLGYMTDLYETIKIDETGNHKFIEFKEFVDKLECKGGRCPNFHALFNGSSETDSRIDKLTECMNETSRRLSRDEVRRAMDFIKRGD